MSLTIHPLNLGTLINDRSGLTLRKGLGTKLEVPCMGWLILGGEEPVLVDTGPSEDVDWGSTYHNPFTRVKEQSLAFQLDRHGIFAGDIKTVILTHLHWDHCYGNYHFPQARFFIQRRELDYAKDPLECDRPIYETDLGTHPYLVGEKRFELLHGDAELTKHIRTVLMPGHSPGLQGVLVQTSTQRVLIGSDHFPLFDNIEQNIPTGIILSVPDWYEASARVRELSDLILPGHDGRVLEKECYQ